MASVDSPDQLEDAIHELDDMFQELQTLGKGSPDRNYKGHKSSPNASKGSTERRTSNASYRGGNTVKSNQVNQRQESPPPVIPPRDPYPSAAGQHFSDSQIRPSSGYFSDDETYNYPTSIPVFDDYTYQTPRRNAPVRFSSYRPTRRLFSDPSQEPYHSSFPLHFRPEPGNPRDFSTMKNQPRRRIGNNSFLSPSSPSRDQYQTPPPSTRSESDYDEVPDEHTEETISETDDTIADYDEIPDLPQQTTPTNDAPEEEYDVVANDVSNTEYNANGTLPYKKDRNSSKNRKPEYTQVQMKKNKPAMVIQMKRVGVEPLKGPDETMANETAFHQSPAAADARRMTTQLGINFDEDEWSDVSRRASRITVGAPEVPPSTGPVVNTTAKEPNKKTTCPCCGCRCHFIMTVLTVLAIVLFIFALIAYIYLGIANDNEINRRHMSSLPIDMTTRILRDITTDDEVSVTTDDRFGLTTDDEVGISADDDTLVTG